MRRPGERLSGRRVGRLALAALLSLTVLLGAGCQRQADGGRTVAHSVTLLHYFSFNEAFSGVMDRLAEGFNRSASTQKLTVLPVDHESFKTSILEDLRRGNAADLYSYWAGARVRTVLEHLAPLDDTLPISELSRAFAPSVIQSAAMYDGHVYLLPLTQHFVGFFYNKKVFAEHDVAPPRTWDEFLRAVVKLRRKGVVPVALGAKAKWPAQFWFDYLLLRTAPQAYRERLLNGKAAFTDPEVRRVFSLWNDLVRAGAFNAHPNEMDFDQGAAALVHRGEAAMTLGGTWLIGFYSGPEYQWREGEDYGFFPFPEVTPNIPRVALGPIDGLVLPKAAKNPRGAKDALRYFASVPVQEELSRATGALAPNLAVSDQAYSPLKQAVRSEIRNCESWAFNFDLMATPAIAEVGLNLFAQFLEFPDRYPYLLEKAEARLRMPPTP